MSTMPKTYCATWCSGGCTKAKHDRAMKVSVKMVVALTKAYPDMKWKAAPNHNTGWYPRAKLSNGRLAVRCFDHQRTIRTFSAYLDGGRWYATGASAAHAVLNVITLARAELERLTSALKGLP